MDAQQIAQPDVQALVLSIFLDNWWCAFGAFGGLLYGYFRLPFASHKPKHPQWRWLFRMEVAAVAAAFTALLMSAFVKAPDLYTKVVAILCVAPITGMAAPPFFDFIWRPALWPLLKWLFVATVGRGVKKAVDAGVIEADDHPTLMKFIKKGK